MIDKISQDNTTLRELILLVLKLEYSGITRSIPWLLMPWLQKEPGHQQPWYWIFRINGSLASMRNYCTACAILLLQNDRNYKYTFNYKINSLWKGLINWDSMVHICISEQGYHWFLEWLDAPNESENVVCKKAAIFLGLDVISCSLIIVTMLQHFLIIHYMTIDYLSDMVISWNINWGKLEKMLSWG